MADVFIKLLEMSVTAGWLMLVVFILRLCLKKVASKAVVCFLWLFVAFRLILPFSFESRLSLLPQTEPINERVEMIYDSNFGDKNKNLSHNTVSAVVSSDNNSVNTTTKEPSGLVVGVNDDESDIQKEPVIGIWNVAGYIWALGVAVMLCVAAVSYIKLKRRVSASLKTEDGTFICDEISSPFILGFFKPRIYLPSTLNGETKDNVMAHERAHIRNLDYLWKLIGFLLLAVYWFSPLVWVSYILFCRDIETACDERVVKNMTVGQRTAYSKALLQCSMSKRSAAVCPLAFGEVGVKQRIKSVLKFKKPTFWVSMVAVVLCVAVGVFFLTDPLTDNKGAGDDSGDTAVTVNEPMLVLDGYRATANGISLLLDSYDLTSAKPYINVMWINGTKNDLIIGRYFDVLYNSGTEFKKCAVKPVVVTDDAVLIPKGESGVERYDMSFFDLTRSGTYRFEVPVPGYDDKIGFDFKIFQKVTENYRDSYYIEDGELEFSIKGQSVLFPEHISDKLIENINNPSSKSVSFDVSRDKVSALYSDGGAVKFLYTDDFGRNWNETVVDDSKQYSRVTLDMLNSKVGFASLQEQTVDEASRVVLYKTRDGGKTWVKVSNGSAYPQRDIMFLDERVGFAICDDTLRYAVIVRRTEDGGKTWESSRMMYSDIIDLTGFNAPTAEVIDIELGRLSFVATAKREESDDVMTATLTSVDFGKTWNPESVYGGNVQSFKTDCYEYDTGDEAGAAQIKLQPETNMFSFLYTPYSSYMAYGAYEESDGVVVAETRDGYKYYFVKNGASLIFDGQKSDPLPGLSQTDVSSVPDGAEFRLVAE